MTNPLAAIAGALRGRVAPPVAEDAPAPPTTPEPIPFTPYRSLRIDPTIVSTALTDAIAPQSQNRQAETIRLRGAFDGLTNADLKAKALEEANYYDSLQRNLQTRSLGGFAPDGSYDGPSTYEEPYPQGEFPMSDYREGNALRSRADEIRSRRPVAPRLDPNARGTLAQDIAVLLTGALGGRADLAQTAVVNDARRRENVRYQNDQVRYNAEERARLEEAGALERRAAQSDRQEDAMTRREQQAYVERQTRYWRERGYEREDARFKAGQELQREQIAAQDRRAELERARKEQADNAKNLDSDTKYTQTAFQANGGREEGNPNHEAVVQTFAKTHGMTYEEASALFPIGRSLRGQQADEKARATRAKEAIAAGTLGLKQYNAVLKGFQTELAPVLRQGTITQADADRINARARAVAADWGIAPQYVPMARAGMTTAQYLGDNGLAIRNGQLQLGQDRLAETRDHNSFMEGIAQQNANTSRNRANGTYGASGVGTNKEYEAIMKERRGLQQDFDAAAARMRGLEAEGKGRGTGGKDADGYTWEQYNATAGDAKTKIGTLNRDLDRFIPKGGAVVPPGSVKAAAAQTRSDAGPSCANFACKVGNTLYRNFPKTNGAGELVSTLKKRGAIEIPRDQAREGDVVYYVGPQYGAMKDANGNGYHVGFVAGNGANAEVRDSSGNVDNRQRKLRGDSRVLRLPESMRIGGAAKPAPATPATTPKKPVRRKANVIKQGAQKVEWR